MNTYEESIFDEIAGDFTVEELLDRVGAKETVSGYEFTVKQLQKFVDILETEISAAERIAMIDLFDRIKKEQK